MPYPHLLTCVHIFTLAPPTPPLPPQPQRDVEVEVSSVDRAGNFQGTLRVGRLNLGGAAGGSRARHLFVSESCVHS